MQAIRNKFHGKSKRRSAEPMNTTSFNNAAPIDPLPSDSSSVVTDYSETHRDLPGGAHVDQYHKTEVSAPSSLPMDNSSSWNSSSIPTPPPMPPTDFWSSGREASYYDQFFLTSNAYPTMATTVFPTQSSRSFESMPVEVIEKPIIVHESIRREQVEEVQEVVQVEREKTEIRQITQPILDKEVKPVLVEERVLAVEVLPTIIREGAPMPEIMDRSTQSFEETKFQVVEKTPIVQETEKWRIIEEIQPVIYREVIVPHLIRTTRPMREVIVEAPIFTEQVYQSRQLTVAERERYSAFFARETVPLRDIQASSFPITSLPASSSIPIVPVATVAPLPLVKPVHEKEILEEVVTTTTTTTVAPVVGPIGKQRGSSFSRGAPVASSEPLVVGRTHDVKFGPMGETLTKDTVTTTSQVLPTRAN